MIIRKPTDIPYSQVTPRHLYLNRRRFLAAASAGLGAFAAPSLLAGGKLAAVAKSPFSTTEKPTSLQDITHYNNF
jgi:methionine sulfoxide reductase catalytic subunit